VNEKRLFVNDTPRLHIRVFDAVDLAIAMKPDVVIITGNGSQGALLYLR
jgi:hypothetical protein